MGNVKRIQEFRAPRKINERAIQDISDKMNELVKAVNQIPFGQLSSQVKGKVGDIRLEEKADKTKVAVFKFKDGDYEVPLTFVEK